MVPPEVISGFFFSSLAGDRSIEDIPTIVVLRVEPRLSEKAGKETEGGGKPINNNHPNLH